MQLAITIYSVKVIHFTILLGPSGPDDTVSILFWTLPERETPVIISNFTVQPSIASLHLRWRTNLPCLSRYVARVCTVLPPVTCKASMVIRDRER